MGYMLDRMKISLKISLTAVFFTTAAAMAAPKPLVVWLMPNGAAPQETLGDCLNKFTKATGIPTKIQVLDWGGAWNRINLALSGKVEAPDVLQLGTTWVPYFASQGKLKALNGELSRIQPDRFVNVSWNTTHVDGDSTIYSVPWFIDVRPVLANKRILKKNGISKESVATYDGFVAAIRKINESKEYLEGGIPVRGYAFPGKSDWNIPHNFAPWIWSNGGSFLAKDSSGKWHANILSKETLLGIATYLNFISDSLVNPETIQTNTSQIAQQFNNGELGFIINTSDIVMQVHISSTQGGLAEAPIGIDSVVVLPIPHGKVGSISFVGGSNLAIPSTNTRKEAMDLLQFLVSDEQLDDYTKNIGLLPPSKKVLQKWAEQEDFRTLFRALESGRSYVAIPEWSEVEQLLISMFTAIWEHMEIPSLYSEEKFYEIFEQYTNEINAKLGYTAESLMTLEEFKKTWGKNVVNDQPKAAAPSKDNAIDSNAKKTPFVFIAMVILGFLFAFLRKRK